MYLSTFSENNLINMLLRNTSFTQPANIYIALSTTKPNEDGSNVTEPSGGGYSRITANSWTTSVAKEVSNMYTLEFPVATASWGLITHIALFDGANNMLAYGMLSVPKDVKKDEVVSFPANSITFRFSISEEGGLSLYSANAILNHLFKNSAYTPASTVYALLSTKTISSSDSEATITQPDDTGYAKQVVTFGNPNEGITSNNSVVQFGQSTKTWNIYGIAIVTASGNILFYGNFENVQNIEAGSFVRFAQGAIVISLD